MLFRFAAFLASFLALNLLVSAPSNAEDISLPQPFDPTTLDNLLANPPFNRVVNPSDSLVLTGFAVIEGKPVVTILNTETKESFVVSETPNALGWTLQEALPNSDITRAQAMIAMGGEVVNLRYKKDIPNADSSRSRDQGRDRGSRPGEGSSSPSEGFRRQGQGPSQEDIDRYRSLSDSAREKLRDEFMRNRERLMTATPEERSAFMRSTRDRIEREDQSQGSKR